MARGYGWERYFANLSSFTFTNNLDPNTSDIAHKVSLYNSCICDPSDPLHFSVAEIEEAILHLPKKKATGLDRISSEHLLYSAKACAPILCNLFNSILLTGSVPSSFCQSIIIPLFKGQGKVASDPSNYRGISLTSILSK